MVLPIMLSFAGPIHASDFDELNIIADGGNMVKRSYKYKPDIESGSSTWIREHSALKVSHITHANSHLKALNLPTAFDVRTLDPKFPAPYDQGSLGSCTANALAALVQYDNDIEGRPSDTPSRLFICFNERSIEGSVYEDSGASLSTGIRTLHESGVCKETLWPYNISQFRTRPSKAAFLDALNNVDLDENYTSVDHIDQSLSAIKYVLGVSHRPFVFGIQIFESFESQQVARTGIVPMPKPGEQCLGGHAVLAVGYDDHKGTLTVRNSWGENWGDHGYFHLPYGYATNPNLALDFWTISKIGKKV